MHLSTATVERARRAAGRRPGDGAEDRRLPAAARRRSARSTSSTRSRASGRRGSSSCEGWSPRDAARAARTALAAALCVGLALGERGSGAGAGARGRRGRARCVAAALAGGDTGALAVPRRALASSGWWWGSVRLDALDRSPLAARDRDGGARQLVVTAPPRARRFAHARAGRVRSVRRRAARASRVLLELPLGRAPPQGAVLDALAVVARAARARERLRRAHVAAPPRRPRRAARRRWRVVGRRGGARRPRRPAARAARAARSRPGSRASAARSSRASCSATTQASRDALRDRFRASGLYHLLAVSGQNVALVAGGALVLAWLLGLPRLARRARRAGGDRRRTCSPSAPQPSVVRAGVAGALGSLAWLAGAPARPLVLPAARRRSSLLAWNPYTLLDAGLPAVVRRGRGDLRRSRRGCRACSRATRCRAGLARVVAISTACGVGDGADALAAVRRRAAARGAGERARRAGDAAAARPRAARGRCSTPSRRALRRCVAWLNGWCAAYLAGCARARRRRCRSRRSRSARGGRGARRRALAAARLCLAAMADELKPVYLIAGSDRPKIERALERLRAASTPDAVELLSAAEATGEDVVAACNALGLFGGGGRLDRRRGRRGLEGGGREGDRRVPARRRRPDTVLALVGAELKKDSPLAKAVREGRRRARSTGRREARAPALGRGAVQAARRDGRRRRVPRARRARRRRPARARDARSTSSRRGPAASAITERGRASARRRRAPRRRRSRSPTPGARATSRAVLAAAEALLERSGDPRRARFRASSALLASHVARVRACQALDGRGRPSARTPRRG